MERVSEMEEIIGDFASKGAKHSRDKLRKEAQTEVWCYLQELKKKSDNPVLTEEFILSFVKVYMEAYSVCAQLFTEGVDMHKESDLLIYTVTGEGEHARHFSKNDIQTRYNILCSFGTVQPILELRQASKTYTVPLFLYTLPLGMKPELINSEDLYTTIYLDAEKFMERETNKEERRLLYDVESKKMMCCRDIDGTSMKFSSLRIAQLSSHLNPKNKRRMGPRLTNNETTNSVCLFEDQNGQLVGDVWVKSGKSDIDMVLVSVIPDEVEDSFNQEWIAMCKKLSRLEQQRCVHLFIKKGVVQNISVCSAVSNNEVHIYRCTYEPNISAMAGLHEIKRLVLSNAHSLIELRNVIGESLTNVCPDIKEEDVIEIANLYRYLSTHGMEMVRVLGSHVSNLGDPLRYANFSKDMKSRETMQALALHEKRKEEQEQKRQEDLEKRKKTFQLHNCFWQAAYSSTVPEDKSKKRKAGRPRKSIKLMQEEECKRRLGFYAKQHVDALATTTTTPKPATANKRKRRRAA